MFIKFNKGNFWIKFEFNIGKKIIINEKINIIAINDILKKGKSWLFFNIKYKPLTKKIRPIILFSLLIIYNFH